MGKKLTICVITFNSEKYLPALLESIGASVFRDFELLFIDNASRDDTTALLGNDQLEKNVVRLPRNMGHSYAANLAMEKCRTRYLVLMDHDTVADKDLFAKLYQQAEKDRDTDFAVFAPVIVDRVRRETYYGGEFHYIGKTYTNRSDTSLPECGMIGSTAPLLDLDKVPREVIFDDDLFIYWNDADFFYRLRALKKKIRLVPDAAVYHLGGTKDYSHRGGAEYSPIRAFYVMRNHRLFIIKNYSLRTILIFLPCFLVYELYSIAFSVRKRIFIKGYLRSIAGTLRLFSKMIKKRIVFQRARMTEDKDLVGWYRLDYNPGVAVTRAEKLSIRMLDDVFKTYYMAVKGTFWK